MINITLPDGSVREYESGVTGFDIARSLSNSLAREVLSINVDEELWDITRPIVQDASIKLNKFDAEDGKHAFWHSSAHLMAEAIEALFRVLNLELARPSKMAFTMMWIRATR